MYKEKFQVLGSRSCQFLPFIFSPPLFFFFSRPVFSSAGRLRGFISLVDCVFLGEGPSVHRLFIGKVWGKAVTITGLNRRKCRWVMKQDFYRILQINFSLFFAFFFDLLSWIVLIPALFERSVISHLCTCLVEWHLLDNFTHLCVVSPNFSWHRFCDLVPNHFSFAV